VGWSHERAVEYFNRRRGDRGVILWLADNVLLTLPARGSEFVLVDWSGPRETWWSRSGRLEDLVAGWYRARRARVLGCGEESGCWPYEGCTFELEYEGGETERVDVCEVL